MADVLTSLKHLTDLTLGLVRDGPTYLEAILGLKGAAVTRTAKDTLRFVAVDHTEPKLSLYVISVEELGYLGGADFELIERRIKKAGLELCPAEVGPALRLLLKKQPDGQSLYVAMEPIKLPVAGLPKIFHIYQAADHPAFDVIGVSEETHFSGETLFVVVKRI